MTGEEMFAAMTTTRQEHTMNAQTLIQCSPGSTLTRTSPDGTVATEFVKITEQNAETGLWHDFWVYADGRGGNMRSAFLWSLLKRIGGTVTGVGAHGEPLR